MVSCTIESRGVKETFTKSDNTEQEKGAQKTAIAHFKRASSIV